jgi:tRNA threonylcarbamoyl adenosine modification protein YeaZ
VWVLALDTATDAVVVGLLTLPEAGEPTVLAERALPGARRHGEQLMPAALEVCAAAGRRLSEVDAVVCGVGPGPFTGLRVGLVSAASMADALGVPAYGVCSLDAIAAEAGADTGGPLLVVADARRRELYWAAYDAEGRRTEGPAVDAPAALADRVAELGVRRVAGPVAAVHADALGLPEFGVALAPTPCGLVTVAEADLRARRRPPPLEPYYLRRPDAVPPGARKKVTPGASRG